MAFGIKLVQSGVTIAAGTAVHPSPITVDVGILCFLSFTGPTTSYQWALTVRPTGSGTVMSSATSAGPTILTDIDGGAYSVTFTDSDLNVYVLDIVTPTAGGGGGGGGGGSSGFVAYATTYASLRVAAATTDSAITYDVKCRSLLEDNGGGGFDYDSTDTTSADNDGTILVCGTRRYKRRYSGSMYAAWFGMTPSAAVIHDGNATDLALAAVNKAALVAMGDALDALGGGVGKIQAGDYAMIVGSTCLHSVNWTGVVFEGESRKATQLFDPNVHVTVPLDGSGGAFFWFQGATRCAIKKLSLIGPGVSNFSTAITSSITRTDKKGIYWASPSTDCLTEDVHFEGIEGETWFVDGGVGALATRNVARNCSWYYCYSNIWNLASGSIYAVDCGVEDCRGEGAGQSTFQMGGTRWFAKRVYSKAPADALAADQLLVYNSAYGFEVEDVTLDGFDLTLSTVSVCSFGQTAGNIKGTVKRLKLKGCKISTDAGSVNALVNIHALADTGFGPVNIDGLVIDGLEFDGCGGISGPGGKITGVRFNGPNSIDATVTNVVASNGPTGALNHISQTMADVPSDNRITLQQHTNADLTIPHQFNVDPWVDHVSPRKVIGATTADRLASVEGHLFDLGLLRDPAFLPSDITSVPVTGWYEPAFGGVILGPTLKASGTTPPAVTISGGLNQVLGLQIDITTGGTLVSGLMRFRWSTDNGSTWKESSKTPDSSTGVYLLGVTAITATFASGTYNADNLYEVTVATWQDLSTAGHDLSPASLVHAHEGRLIFSALNGEPALDLDGTDDFYGIAYTRSKPSYVMAVVWATDSTASGTVMDGLSANQTRFYRTGATQWSIYAGTVLNAGAVTPETPHIIECLWNGGSSYVHEANVAKAAGAAGANNAAAGFSIGAFNNASDYFKGRYAMIVLCDGEPTAAEKDALRASVTTRYGL